MPERATARVWPLRSTTCVAASRVMTAAATVRCGPGGGMGRGGRGAANRTAAPHTAAASRPAIAATGPITCRAARPAVCVAERAVIAAAPTGLCQPPMAAALLAPMAAVRLPTAAPHAAAPILTNRPTDAVTATFPVAPRPARDDIDATAPAFCFPAKPKLARTCALIIGFGETRLAAATNARATTPTAAEGRCSPPTPMALRAVVETSGADFGLPVSAVSARIAALAIGLVVGRTPAPRPARVETAARGVGAALAPNAAGAGATTETIGAALFLPTKDTTPRANM